MKRYVNDVAYSQLFFFLGAMITMTLVPKVLPIVMLYFYLLISVIYLIMYKVNKLVGLMIMQILQVIIVFILLIYIMADDWCYFYLYRSHT
jgi:hypothetical protein